MSTNRTNWILVAALGASALTACDRSGAGLIPQPSDEYPSVIELGELKVVDYVDLAALMFDGCTPNDASTGCAWASVGASISSGVRSGATFTFTGTGGEMCLIVDPEAVTWNTSVAYEVVAGDSDWQYRYPDNTRDDGDMDLFAGLTSYYTGSPGVELGDFVGYYTDSLGQTVEIEYSACNQTGSRGQDNAHAGRGAVEYCTVDTTGLAGISLTAVLDSFAVPLDDAVGSFKAVIVDAPCSEASPVDTLTITACSITAGADGVPDWNDGNDDTNGDGVVDDDDCGGDGVLSDSEAYYTTIPDECMLFDEAIDLETGAPREGVAGLEAAYCNTSSKSPALVAYCCDHPELCGDEPEGLCDELDDAIEEGEVEFE